MNIIDIKFMGDNAYLLKSCTVTTDELKQSITSFNYNELYGKYREYFSYHIFSIYVEFT